MKSIVLSLLLISGGLFAQGEQAEAVIAAVEGPVKDAAIVAFQNPMTPLVVLDHFARHYPDTKAIWGFNKEGCTARFKSPSTGLSNIIIYDRSGKITRFEQEIKVDCCPRGILEFVMSRFRSQDVTVWSCQEGDDVSYYVKRGIRLYWFNRDGSYTHSKVNLFANDKNYM
jgi:hypothetical protein